MLYTPELSIEPGVSVPARLTGMFDWRFWHFASDAPCAQDVRVVGIGGLAVNGKSTRMTRTGLPPLNFYLSRKSLTNAVRNQQRAGSW
jgi:hypothetical protein